MWNSRGRRMLNSAERELPGDTVNKKRDRADDGVMEWRNIGDFCFIQRLLSWVSDRIFFFPVVFSLISSSLPSTHILPNTCCWICCRSFKFLLFCLKVNVARVCECPQVEWVSTMKPNISNLVKKKKRKAPAVVATQILAIMMRS